MDNETLKRAVAEGKISKEHAERTKKLKKECREHAAMSSQELTYFLDVLAINKTDQAHPYFSKNTPDYYAVYYHAYDPGIIVMGYRKGKWYENPNTHYLIDWLLRQPFIELLGFIRYLRNEKIFSEKAATALSSQMYKYQDSENYLEHEEDDQDE